MTEAEWMVCTDPDKMQVFLRGKASGRKMDLFAAACCRLVWGPITDERFRKAIEQVERFADGKASSSPGLFRTTGAETSSEYIARSRLLREIIGNPFRPLPPERGRKKWEQMWRSWLEWNDGTVVRLAQAAYEERHLPEGTLDNGQLAILADALEEAGCTDADILGHLRRAGPHVRGCWVLDLCLGKS